MGRDYLGGACFSGGVVMSESKELRDLHSRMPVNSVRDAINRLFELGEDINSLGEPANLCW